MILNVLDTAKLTWITSLSSRTYRTIKQIKQSSELALRLNTTVVFE